MADDEIDYQVSSPSPSVIYNNNYDEDFSSLNGTDDDYTPDNDPTDDDGRYFSTKHTTSWLDNLISQSSASNSTLTPVEDVNPDNVLATLIFNSIVCILLLGLYELLRRWIPSVYSQRLMHEKQSYNNNSQLASPITERERQFVQVTHLHASGKSLKQFNRNSQTGIQVDEDDTKTSTSTLHCLPILEWCIPVHSTPWSTFRQLAGLDAYFYLRYIRMCLKITTVSSFWAIIILWPVYASGGNNAAGFYHFSMANVLQEDKGRVWVPTFFCWLFTMYCWFCIRGEMIHYVELRMEFLGGEEEKKSGGYGAPNVVDAHAATVDSYGNEINSKKSKRSRSPLLAAASSDEADSSAGITSAVPLVSQPTTQVQKEMKQHQYSLQVERIPENLRSNTALFNYFDDLFPGQVHSARITMNVPDLDALLARRDRVCRRLEKSLAYYNVTGIRPTHIAGRPRCQCLGIESTPIDGWCVACCCFYDSNCNNLNNVDDGDEDNSPMEVYDNLPEKGEVVDSILYYTCDLANSNIQMKALQSEKFMIANTGTSPRKNGDSEGDNDWYAHPLSMLQSSAAMAAEGLREEFEVGEEDYLSGNGVNYGAVTARSMPRRSSPRREPLINGKVSPAPTEEGDEGSTVSSQQRTRYHMRRPYIWLRSIMWRMGVDFLSASLDEVKNKTDTHVDHVTRPSMSSTGFVTFKTLTPVTVTNSAPLTYNRNPMQVSIAPEPRDLVWRNCQIDSDIGAQRAFIANVLIGLGVLLWSIPLTFIQAWAKVENVAMIPGLEWVADLHGGTWKPLINGYLPVVALLGLILLLPLIFNAVATLYERRKTLSSVQNSIVGRYFYYQLANIYITVTAGAIWTSLAEIIDHPQNLLVVLGETLPMLAGYFISLLITKTLAGLPMVLLRLGALSRMMFLRSCFNKKRLTQRELKEVYRKQPIYYGWEYPTQFLVIIICFTYACITPFVLCFGAVYFAVALLVYKKQALYVYTPTYESGGRMFPQAISKTIFALLISQLTFIGYSLIRKAVFQIILLAPLPFLTAWFSLFIEHRYVEPSKKLSLERAVRIDALSENETPEFSVEAYQQPCLTEKAALPQEETNDDTCKQVIENLTRLQNESPTQSNDRGV